MTETPKCSRLLEACITRYKKGAHYNVSKSTYVKDANLGSGRIKNVLAAIVDLVLERNIKSVDFGMLELPSGNLSLEEYIKLATSAIAVIYEPATHLCKGPPSRFWKSEIVVD